MKITDVEAMVLRAPQLYSNPEGAEEAYGIGYTSIIRVSTDEGITGTAQIEAEPHVIKAIIDAPPQGGIGFDGLRSVVLGSDPFTVEQLWEKMYMGSIYYGRRGAAIQAMSGIDLACWDIMGKATGQPIYKLLGAGYCDKVRAYASTLFRSTPEAMREAAKRYVDQGFTAIKFGWGVFGRNLDLDLRLVEAAREAVGDAIDLLIDAGWYIHRTPKENIAMAKRLAQFNPFWIEEPAHPEDYDGYAELAQAVDTRIAAGEQEATIWGFRTLIDRGKVDVVQPDLSRCGGLTVARQIAHEAQARNTGVCPHAWMSDILTAASLHFNTFLRDALFIEFNTTTGPFSRELTRNPLQVVDGYIAVPQGPGLGVEINEAAIERYRIA